jgi:hypothetical protein
MFPCINHHQSSLKKISPGVPPRDGSQFQKSAPVQKLVSLEKGPRIFSKTIVQMSILFLNILDALFVPPNLFKL